MDMQFKTDYFQRLEKVNKPIFMNRMINEVAVIAVNFSKERFVKKNWLDKVPEAWKARKRTARGSLLVRTGRLKRSIRKLATGKYYVYIGTDVPYAQIHNEGGTINKTVTVKSHSRKRTARAVSEKTGKKLKKRVNTGMMSNIKAHSRKMSITMTKRQFLGDSEALAKRAERHISRQLDKEIEKL